MSRIPYLERLGDEFERAVTESAPRRQLGGGAVLAIAFVLVLLAGASLWVLRDGRDPDIAQTSTTTTTSPQDLDSIDAPAIPTTWARVPGGTSLPNVRRITLSGITTTSDGFAAAGTGHIDDAGPPIGVIITSPDGIEWHTLSENGGAAINDITFGSQGLMAPGMRDFLPIVVTGGGSIIDLPILDGTGERAIMARAIAARGDGYIVVGDESVYDGEQRMRGSVWLSADGVEWNAVESPAFDWYHEAYLNDVIVTADGIVAVGLAGSEAGTTLPMVWLSSDGTSWERIELPTNGSGGFTGTSGIAFGHGRYVVVGDQSSSSGTDGTAWVSGDARNWTQIDGDALAGAERTGTRIHSITAVADGFVAVGHSFERPALRHVIWTADTTGMQWARLDLADPGGDVSTSATSLATNSDRVVVAGSTFDITFSEASPAVWVGPAPSSLEVSTPITTTIAPSDDDGTRASITIDPATAVGATSVRVVGRLPADHGLDEVLVQLESRGTTVDFCNAVAQGRNFMCRATIADLTPQPGPGVYTVVAAGILESAEPATIEILPEGSQIIVMSGIYTPTYGPLVQSITVQNKGANSVDVGGWRIVNEGREIPNFEFPAGTVVPAGASAGLDFSGARGGICPQDSDTYFHWCNVASDSGRIDYGDERLLWKGATLQLLDTNGEVVAEWQPGG